MIELCLLGNIRQTSDELAVARDPTLRKILRVQPKGNGEVNREIDLHDLAAMICVAYRVNSPLQRQEAP